MKRILICGGRDYGKIDAKKPLEHPKRVAERRKVSEVLEGLYAEFGPFLMIHGDAVSGADRLADNWQRDWDAGGAPIEKPPEPLRFPAAWDDLSAPDAVIKTVRYGVRKGKPYDALAGFRRNQKMIDDGKPDLVVAFPGGNGTRDMTERAEKANVEVREVS